MIEQFIFALNDLHLELTDKEIADILWLALQIDSSPVESIFDALEIPDQLLLEILTIPTPSSRASDKTETQDERIPAKELKESSLSVNRGKLYPAFNVDADADEETNTLPFRTPAAPALSSKLALGRALRPLMRTVPSHSKVVIDEAQTVQRIAEEGIWLPIMNPARERWLEVALVVDMSRSMAIWWHSIVEFQLLLEQHGAFRDVRMWELVSDDKGESVRLQMGSLSNRGQSTHAPSELLDPSGRRLILLISDCVKQTWYNDIMVNLLASWGKSNPVLLIQVLPQALWAMSALGDAIVTRLRAKMPGQANTQLAYRLVNDWDNKEKVNNWLRLPVVTLEPGSFTDWALAFTGSLALKGSEKAWTRGYLFDTQISSIAKLKNEERIQKNDGIFLSAEDRLKIFRATASPVARKLAGLLAATPITLPIVRLIQKTMLPESQLSHVAEVFLGGLLEQLPTPAVDTDDIQYDFILGVRELLLDSQPTNESAQVLENISTFIEDHIDQPLNFHALLANPSSFTPIEAINYSNINYIQPFATIGAKVLRRLGGRYTQVAEQLEQRTASSLSAFDKSDLPQQMLIPQVTSSLSNTDQSDLSQQDLTLQVQEQGLESIEQIQHIMRQINEAFDLQQALEILLQESQKQLAAKQGLLRGSILLPNFKAQNLEIRAFTGSEHGFQRPIDISLKRQKGITHWVFENKQSVRVANVQEQPPWKDLYIETDSKLRSELDVPLLNKEEVIGIINFEGTEKDMFTKEDENFLTQLAGQVSLVIKDYIYEDSNKTQRNKKKSYLPVVVTTSVESRLVGSILAVLTSENGYNEAIIRAAVDAAKGQAVVFLYLAEPDQQSSPRIFEVVDPYLDDLKAKKYFGNAENLAQQAKIQRRFVYRIWKPGTIANIWQIVRPRDIIIAADHLNGSYLENISPDRIRYEITSSGKLAHILKTW